MRHTARSENLSCEGSSTTSAGATERYPLRFRLARLSIALATYAGIGLLGVQYAFPSIFSVLRRYDDEGTMMLRVKAFIDDPAGYASLGGMYGPFYYLHKLAIYQLFSVPLSHDTNRLTTIAFWIFISAAGAAFVHRVTRSIVFAALVQFQLTRRLNPLVFEPGHPHELCLALIFLTVLLSSLVSETRKGMLALAVSGAAAGALLLVKVNVGVYLVAPLSLALLLTVSPRPLARAILFAAIIVALLVPPAILWRHLQEPWAFAYNVVVTSAIAASLIVSHFDRQTRWLPWRHVAATGLGAALAIAGVLAVVLAWGVSLTALLDTMIWRALRLPNTFSTAAPMQSTATVGAAAALLLAIACRLAAERIARSGAALLTLAIAKLSYGCFILYWMYRIGGILVVSPVALPFVWLVLVPPGGEDRSLRQLFPRLFLSLAAAFQALQAYPVYGSQARWSVLLLIPAAAICVADGLSHLATVLARRSAWSWSLRARSWRHILATLLALAAVFAIYNARLNIATRRAIYERRTPLGLPGASRIRLPRPAVLRLRTLIASLVESCDGFVAMPGFASLYFWTPQPPPGVLNNAWLINVNHEEQRSIVARMKTYNRPCVLYNGGLVEFWLRGREMDTNSPLAQYIREEFAPGPPTADFVMLARKKRPAPGRHTQAP